ncbi:MAG: Zn-ribbon domain-containing OB-fold protein [Sphingomonadales bacterium]
MSLRLQVCAECGAVQYPHRDVCGACLSTQLEDKDVSGAGTVLSWTRGHVSVFPDAQTPISLARVKLDAGPIVLALASSALITGEAVHVMRDEDGLLRRS